MGKDLRYTVWFRYRAGLGLGYKVCGCMQDLGFRFEVLGTGGSSGFGA